MWSNGAPVPFSRAARLGLAFIATLAVGGAHSTAPDIVVNTTSDVVDLAGSQQLGDLSGPDGVVSLREAIIAANRTPGPQVIAFQIPVSDPRFDGAVFTITPQAGLTLSDDGTTIDGATQTAFTGDSNPWGPEIVLDGSVAGYSDGVTLNNSSHNTIRGLVIHSFKHVAIQFIIGGAEIGSRDGNRVVGCDLGTDATGTVALGNGGEGVALNGNVIGGPDPADRNVIAGDTLAEIQVSAPGGPGGGGNVVEGDGVTRNDSGDLDSGPNNLMNYPVLESARATPGRLVVKGTIDTLDPRSVTIELFANPVPVPGADPSGHGEGAVFLGRVRPNPKGEFTAPVAPVPPGTLITATATDAAGNTSEFAANIVVRQRQPGAPARIARHSMAGFCATQFGPRSDVERPRRRTRRPAVRTVYRFWRIRSRVL